MEKVDTGVWPRWKVALAVGAPVALGLVGYMYYKRRQSKASDGSTKPEGKKQNQINTTPKSSPPKVELSPLEKAQASKNKGNKYFKGGRFDMAIACYTEAIEICPQDSKQELATFYQNRAAAYEQLKQYQNVISDCSQALEYNNKYTKAMFRKAKACEQIGELTECLEDVTAVCILEGFQNPQSLQMADRVLKELGRRKAKEAYSKRIPVMPSSNFVQSFFSAFDHDPLKEPKLDESINEKEAYGHPEKEIYDMHPENKSDGQNSPYVKAQKRLQEGEYDEILDLCTEELSGGDSQHMALALLMRATFYTLKGQGQEALADFNKLLQIDGIDNKVRSNALIKRGSLQMQDGLQTEALNDFVTAVQCDPDNSDVYHHRGQLNLLMGNTAEAIKDFDKCIMLNPTFGVAAAQKCYTEHRFALETRNPVQLQGALKSFEDTLQKFPDCHEAYALYGQTLTDQQLFEKADENFQKAADLEPDNANMFVHRGLLCLQWHQDLEKARGLIRKALEVDEKCEFAYETLGTIEVQRGNLAKAIELFNEAIKLSKTELEMCHLYSLLDAALAQAKVAKKLGISLPSGLTM